MTDLLQPRTSTPVTGPVRAGDVFPEVLAELAAAAQLADDTREDLQMSIEPEPVRPARTPEEMAKTMTQHFGIWVSEIGEDGALVALGHHEDKRRLVAALNRHHRKTFDCPLIDNWPTTGHVAGDYAHALNALDETWGLLLDLPSHDPDVPWWLQYSGVTPDTNGAFPITMIDG